ncbi:TRAP transporter small permease subunit [Brevibacterium album]|uniref:TRAP transporter small permease subunit n=1 Tax=Brevibacterium album TaxID=417948 RepID=UPI00041AD993|nr:TRAP transporter small permease subunit [Brevibacterium album]
MTEQNTNEQTVTEGEAAGAGMHPLVRGLGTGSAVLASLALALLLLIMLAETAARYALSAPLGWNVSAVERILMPGAVFLALPWMYVCAGHVSAGLVYSRLSPRARACARVVALAAVLASAALLCAAGVSGAVSAFQLGDAPPPGSSDIAVPTWMWLSLQPIGAGALLLTALVDAPRFLHRGEAGS